MAIHSAPGLSMWRDSEQETDAPAARRKLVQPGAAAHPWSGPDTEEAPWPLWARLRTPAD